MAKKGSTLTEEHREKIRESIKTKWTDSVYRNKISESNKGNPPWSLGKHLSIETCQKIGDANRGRAPWSLGKHLSKETCTKISESNKGQMPWSYGKHLSEETCQKLRIAHKGKKFSDAHKKKLSENHRDQHGSKHPLWKGGISFAPYCINFNNEFKERVRAFFGYQCMECGTPQNGRKLTVHHVNYDKMVCCNDTKPSFACLCASCNSKANANREYWQQYFTDMINNYYGGKCYFSKEEMVLYNGLHSIKVEQELAVS